VGEDERGALVECYRQGGLKDWEENPVPLPSPQIALLIGLGLKWGICGERPATSRLSHDTAI